MEPEFGQDVDFEEIGKTNTMAIYTTNQSEIFSHAFHTPGFPAKNRKLLVGPSVVFVNI